MDWPGTILMFLMILVTQCSNHVVRCAITDVRLVGGPASNKGTVEIRQDNGTWHTTCGINLSIHDVIVICRQLGFTGASRPLPNTTYGQNSSPTSGLTCIGDEADLSECTMFASSCSSTAGAASCHSEGYLGCFIDQQNNRVLPGHNRLNDQSMTISKCIQFCDNSNTSNYTYAGVENGGECYCGEASDDYARLGVGNNSDCQVPCTGNPTDSCGGVGYIAVFTIEFTVPTSLTTVTSSLKEVTSPITSLVPSSTTSEFSSTDQVGIINTGSSSAISTQSTMSTSPQVPPVLPQSGTDTGLYGGIGGGVVGLIIIVVVTIVIILLIRRRSRNRQKDTTPTYSMPSAPPPMPAGINSHGVTNATMQHTSDAGGSRLDYHAGDRASAAASRGDKNRLVVNMNPKSMNVYQGIVDDQQGDGIEPYASVEGFGATYAMPNKNDRLSVVYATPDKSGDGRRNDTSEDVGPIYAMPDKTRGEPDGYEESASQGLHGLYAMPDKSRSRDQCEPGMVENELYAM